MSNTHSVQLGYLIHKGRAPYPKGDKGFAYGPTRLGDDRKSAAKSKVKDRKIARAKLTDNDRNHILDEIN